MVHDSTMKHLRQTWHGIKISVGSEDSIKKIGAQLELAFERDGPGRSDV